MNNGRLECRVTAGDNRSRTRSFSGGSSIGNGVLFTAARKPACFIALKAAVEKVPCGNTMRLSQGTPVNSRCLAIRPLDARALERSGAAAVAPNLRFESAQPL